MKKQSKCIEWQSANQFQSVDMAKITGGEYTATDDLWEWRKNIEDGKIDRRSGSIVF
ncbi:MAG: hypothetical protein AAFQ98_17620 [Bacteroidota bacterium]